MGKTLHTGIVEKVRGIWGSKFTKEESRDDVSGGVNFCDQETSPHTYFTKSYVCQIGTFSVSINHTTLQVWDSRGGSYDRGYCLVVSEGDKVVLSSETRYQKQMAAELFQEVEGKVKAFESAKEKREQRIRRRRELKAQREREAREKQDTKARKKRLEDTFLN